MAKPQKLTAVDAKAAVGAMFQASADVGVAYDSGAKTTTPSVLASAITLAKLDAANSPTNGQVMGYDSATGKLKWRNKPVQWLGIGGVATQGFIIAAHPTSSQTWKFALLTNTTATTHATLPQAVKDVTSTASATTCYCTRGNNGNGDYSVSAISRFEFGSTSGVTSHGSMGSAHNFGATSQNVTNGFYSGYFPGGIARTDKIDFSSSSGAAQHADLAQIIMMDGGCSSQTQGYSIGGFVNGNYGNGSTDVRVYSFANTTQATVQTSLVNVKAAFTGGSSATQGFCFATAYGYGGNAIERFNFADNTIAQSHGGVSTMPTQTGNATLCCSGLTGAAIKNDGANIYQFAFATASSIAANGTITSNSNQNGSQG